VIAIREAQAALDAVGSSDMTITGFLGTADAPRCAAIPHDV
jgi:hypothetical protein